MAVGSSNSFDLVVLGAGTGGYSAAFRAAQLGLKLPGEPEIDYAQMAARRDQVVKRLWTGVKTLIDKNKVTWVQGRGKLEGPTKIRVTQPGEDGVPGKGGDR